MSRRLGFNNRGELNSRVRAGCELAGDGWRALLLAAVTRRGCSCRKAEGCEHPGKHPLVRDWQDRATDDPDRLVADFARYGTDWNVGLLCGVPLRVLDGRALIVLDVDSEDALADLVRRCGRMPETATVRTGRGWHFYFAGPPGSRSFRIAAGLEVKASGLVVCPPSVHFPSYRLYRWKTHRDTIAPAPAWLLRRSVKRSKGAEPVPVGCAAEGIGDSDSIGLSALSNACARLLTEPGRDGVVNRRGRLYAAACSLGELVGAGLLDPTLAEQELQAVADQLGLPKPEVETEIKSDTGTYHIRRGLAHGAGRNS